MKLDSKHGYSKVQLLTFFYFFFLINCNARNKVAQDERLSPVKHNNIIQGKIYYGFKY